MVNDLDNLYRTIKINMKKIRKEKHITQQVLADKVGVTKGYISDMERISQNKHPSIYVLARVSDALNIKIADLFVKE